MLLVKDVYVIHKLLSRHLPNVLPALFHISLTMKQKHVTNVHLINNTTHHKKSVNVQNHFLSKLQKLALLVISHIISTTQQNNVNPVLKITFIILTKINAGDVLNQPQYWWIKNVQLVQEIIHTSIWQFKIVQNVLSNKYTIKKQNNVNVHKRRNTSQANNVLLVSILSFLTIQIRLVNIVQTNKFMMLNYKNVFHAQTSIHYFQVKNV